MLCHSAVVSPIEVEPTNDEIEVQAIHTPPIDEELLNALGDIENIKMGPIALLLNKEIELRWTPILTKGLTKELKNELMTKHVAFENIPMLPPKIKSGNSSSCIRTCQKEKSYNCRETKTSRCCTSSPWRSLISAVINKDMKESLTGDTDSFLFGSDLSEKIKITKAVQKSVKDLRINASNKPTIIPKTKSLNWRAPPRSSARTVTGGRQNLPKQHQKEDRKHRQPFRNIHNNKNNRR
ncbi:hypothetical protein ACJJTC_004597 [Scirpophaga incertulas]